jgi:hypothetical protein
LTPQRIALAVVAAFALMAPSAMAQNQDVPDTVSVTGGVTERSGGARLANPAGSAVRVRGRSFPITGGEIDPADALPADLDHSGRLTFRSGGQRITFRQLNVELGTTNRLFGTNAGQVVALANLVGGTVSRQGLFSTDVDGIRARLTRAGRRAINRALDARVRRGARLGRISIDAQVEDALIDATGDTDLQISPQAAQKLVQAGVSASPIAPATAAAGPGGLPIYSFPIAGGTFKLDQSAANVLHNGGLLLSKGSAQIPLALPAVEIANPPVLTVDLGGARTAAADLDLSSMTKEGTPNGINIGGVVVKLNAAAAALLNASFQMPNHFQAGDVVGTASSTITFR